MARRLAITPYVGSLSFDGVDDNATITNAQVPATALQNGFIIFSWIKPESQGETAGRILDKGESTGGLNGFASFIGSTRLLGLNVNGGTTVSSNPLNTWNIWTNWICQVSANATVSHYVNGVLSGTPATTGALSGIVTTNPLTIGNRSGATDRSFDGKIAQIGVLSLSGRGDLTQDEITNLYTNNVIPTGTKLLHLEVTDGQVSGANWFDKSGLGNTAIISGATTTTDSPTQARTPATNRQALIQPRVAVRDMGTALRFDGSGDYVDTPANSTFSFNASNQSITLSTWFYAGGIITDDCRLFTKEGSNDDVRLRVLTSGNTMRLIFTIDPNAGSPTFSDLTGSVFQPNTWYHVVARYSTTNGLAIYMNGVLVNSNTTVFTGTTGDAVDVKWTIGGDNSGTLSFNGIIDEPRIWNRALSADEVANLYYNNVVPRNGLVAEYLFNEASGTTALDTSGNGNTGTITGATYTTDVPIQLRGTV